MKRAVCLGLLVFGLTGCDDPIREQAHQQDMNASKALKRAVAFWESTPFTDLPEAHKPLAAAYRYDQDVQLGGHLRYFTGQGLEHIDPLLTALDRMDAVGHKDLLARALERYTDKPREPIHDEAAFKAEAAKGEFDGLDLLYYRLGDNLTNLIERELNQVQDRYFPLTPRE